jgi:DNA-binding NarL/FixJ family response regulator
MPKPVVPQQFIIIDDHEVVLNGTVTALKGQYPDAMIETFRTANHVMAQLALAQGDVALVLIDLSIPQVAGEMAKVQVGLQLLRSMMQTYRQLNLVVQSTHIQSLVVLKSMIAEHEGGFTIADKNEPVSDMLTKVEWALRGVVYTPKEIRNGIEVNPEWLEMLKLAFEEGLQDHAIAQRMNVAERTVRRYWVKVQDALGVYPDDDKNLRIQTEKHARDAGLIDL